MNVEQFEGPQKWWQDIVAEDDHIARKAERRLREWLYRGGEPPVGWQKEELLDYLAEIRDEEQWSTEPLSLLLTMDELRAAMMVLRQRRNKTPEMESAYKTIRDHVRSTRHTLNRERRRLESPSVEAGR